MDHVLGSAKAIVTMAAQGTGREGGGPETYAPWSSGGSALKLIVDSGGL